MINIYTNTDKINAINEVIASQERMNELVEIIDINVHKPLTNGYSIIISNKGISLPVDWHNTRPPYLLPEFIWFTESNLLGVIYFLLGNSKMACNYLQENPTLLAEIKITDSIKNEQRVNADRLSVESYHDFDDYRLMHNHAIIRAYSPIELTIEETDKIYYYFNAAIDNAVSDEYAAYTAKQFISYLFDNEEFDAAEHIIKTSLLQDISKEAAIEIKNLQCQIWMRQLVAPYNNELLENLKTQLWENLKHYEANGRNIDAAMVYENAAHIASVTESYSEALGYITNAIKIFADEGLQEFYYNAVYHKAILLYTWAKNENPQFYKSSIESYQEALKLFKKEDYPYIFADIQHHLGNIYADIPDEVKKKSIWAAVSSASFMEALSFFTKFDFPYEYAMVCNSFGNALTKYPASKNSDNYTKALYYYNKALDIRDNQNYPTERSITLLNYIEASWLADNSSNENNPERFEDMWHKSHEVLTINADPKFVSQAKEHIERLTKLKGVLE